MNHFMDCDVKWKVRFIWQPATTSSVVGSSSSKSTSQSETRTEEKGHDHWWSAAYLIYYSFESWWNHYIWEVCSENRWDAPKTATPAAGTGQQKGPNSPWQCPTTHRTTSISKVEWIWLKFCLICNIQWPLEHLPTSHQLPLLWSSQQLFARKTLPWPAGGRECFWRIYRILKHRFLHHRNKSTYFSLAKLCWS